MHVLCPYGTNFDRSFEPIRGARLKLTSPIEDGTCWGREHEWYLRVVDFHTQTTRIDSLDMVHTDSLSNRNATETEKESGSETNCNENSMIDRCAHFVNTFGVLVIDALRTDLDELKLDFQSFLDGHLGDKERQGTGGVAPFSLKQSRYFLGSFESGSLWMEIPLHHSQHLHKMQDHDGLSDYFALFCSF